MATSTETALTATWVEVVSDGSDYVAQNNGNQNIRLWWGATAPAATVLGFTVQPGAGVESASFLAGPIWARAARNDGSIIVNQ